MLEESKSWSLMLGSAVENHSLPTQDTMLTIIMDTDTVMAMATEAL